MKNWNKPVQIKHLTIKNPLAVPPMVCFYWPDENGYVTEKNIRHYRELAEGGFGLVIVEATAITKRGKLHDSELGIWEDGQIEGLRKITDAIHENGAKTFIQLVHAGGNGADPEADAPSDKVYRGHNNGHEMSKQRIAETIEDFVQAALRAKKAGFDGVELHGCHGYLISCFCNSRTNFRTDEYGENKALFAIEALKAVKAACGDDFVVGIRLGAFEPLLEDGLRHAKLIAPFADFLDVSYGGDCDGYAPEDFPCSQAVYGAMRIKQELPEMPVFGVHNINSEKAIEDALSTGIDMVDIGKAALVDPAIAAHILNGEKYGQCLHCNNYCRWNPWEMADETKICPGAVKWQREQ
ncbi:MAG: NADH:flavin oxidoreductase [Acetatifactor sp.]|nr:NADH:flavin oxidoreductase [Acetatifactor sp.]